MAGIGLLLSEQALPLRECPGTEERRGAKRQDSGGAGKKFRGTCHLFGPFQPTLHIAVGRLFAVDADIDRLLLQCGNLIAIEFD